MMVWSEIDFSKVQGRLPYRHAVVGKSFLLEICDLGCSRVLGEAFLAPGQLPTICCLSLWATVAAKGRLKVGQRTLGMQGHGSSGGGLFKHAVEG